MGFLDSVKAVREHLRDAGAVSLEAIALECGVEPALLEPLIRELVEVQRVASFDGGILRWTGGGPAGYTPRHLVEGALKEAGPQGERKQVTILFVDAMRSTQIAGRLDPEAWHDVLDGFFRILTASVHRFEGTVNQYTGDGIMALFGAPVAVEDHAQRACHAVLQARDRLVEYSLEVGRTHGISLAARFGLNSGEVVVGRIGDDLRMDYTAQGRIVAIAQRMESIADPGSCLMTASTAGLVSGYFDLRPVGRREVKGVEEPVEVFELLGRGMVGTRFELAKSRGLTPFVGRRDEMERLTSLLARCGDGHGQVVGIEGEAGTGKSRLCHEFADFCLGWGLRVCHAQGMSHSRRVSLAPIVELARQVFGIGSASDAQAREKVVSRLAVGDTDPDMIAVVHEFLGIAGDGCPPSRVNAESRQRLLLDAMTRVLGRPTAAGPDVVIVEDLHWIDPSSIDLLARLVGRIASMRVLCILNFRPGSRPDWLSQPHGHLLGLSPLRPEFREELVRELLGRDPATDRIARAIAERSGGNPLFVEEMVRMLSEDGMLAAPPVGHPGPGPVASLPIPGSVHGILASRVDRLDPEAKAVLQSAAVIGNEFSVSILASIRGTSVDAIVGQLGRLERAGFLHRRGDNDAVRYAFEHPLTHEVTLESQLQAQRRPTHAAVARAIAEEAGDRAREQAGRIAVHWEDAGEPLAAATWYRTAAEWISRHDKASGIAHWRKVRELAKATVSSAASDRLLCDACLQLVRLSWRLGFAEFEEFAAEGIAAAGRLDDSVTGVLIRLTAAQGSGGVSADFRGWVDRLRGTERLAMECGEPRAVASTRWQIAYARWVTGDIVGCLESLDALDPLADGDEGPGLLGLHLGSMSRMMRSLALAWRGEARAAAAANEQAIRTARVEGRREEHGWALAAAAEIALVGGEHRHAEAADLDRAVAEAVDIAGRVGSPFSWATTLDIGLASAHLHFGRHRAAVETLRESLATIRSQGTYVEGEPRVLARLADAVAAVGELDEAQALVAEAVGLARERGTAHYEAHALVVSASLWARSVGPGRAEAAARDLDAAKSLIERTGAGWLAARVAGIAAAIGDGVEGRLAARPRWNP